MNRIIKKFSPEWIVDLYRTYIKKMQKVQFELETKGDKVKCPICNSSYKQFGDAGLVPRKNAKCYNCSSLERHRLMFLYLSNETDLFEVKGNIRRLLHFAPERFFFRVFSENSSIEYSPCDLFPELFDFGEKIKVQKVDIIKIPFEDNSFDFILCNHVLEHIPNDICAMKELYRVMNHGGKGIFQVPIDYEREETYEDWSITSPFGRQNAFGQKDHVRWYGKDYIKRLESTGFKVESIDYMLKYSKEDIFKLGLMRSEKIFLCKKD